MSDHPALTDALQKNQTAKKGSVIAVYCVCLDQWRQHDMGDWRIAFQLRCLHVLQNELARLHIPLVVLNLGAFDDCAQALLEVAQKHNVGHLSFIDEYPLNERKRDAHVVKLFLEHRLYVERFVADVLVAPGVLQTGKDTPYTVFTPYYKRWKATVVGNWQRCLASPSPQSIPTDQKLPKLQEPIKIHGFDQLQLGENFWPAGEHEAQRRLARFIDEALTDYGTGRDRPDIDGTSGLSAYLAVGCISPRQCVEALVNPDLLQGNSSAAEGATKWLSEIAWRDFYRQIVAQFDHVNKGECFRQEYNHLPWRRDNTDFIA